MAIPVNPNYPVFQPSAQAPVQSITLKFRDGKEGQYPLDTLKKITFFDRLAYANMNEMSKNIITLELIEKEYFEIFCTLLIEKKAIYEIDSAKYPEVANVDLIEKMAGIADFFIPGEEADQFLKEVEHSFSFMSIAEAKSMKDTFEQSKKSDETPRKIQIALDIINNRFNYLGTRIPDAEATSQKVALQMRELRVLERQPELHATFMEKLASLKHYIAYFSDGTTGLYEAGEDFKDKPIQKLKPNYDPREKKIAEFFRLRDGIAKRQIAAQELDEGLNKIFFDGDDFDFYIFEKLSGALQKQVYLTDLNTSFHKQLLKHAYTIVEQYLNKKEALFAQVADKDLPYSIKFAKHALLNALTQPDPRNYCARIAEEQSGVPGTCLDRLLPSFTLKEYIKINNTFKRGHDPVLDFVYSIAANKCGLCFVLKESGADMQRWDLLNRFIGYSESLLYRTSEGMFQFAENQMSLADYYGLKPFETRDPSGKTYYYFALPNKKMMLNYAFKNPSAYHLEDEIRDDLAKHIELPPRLIKKIVITLELPTEVLMLKKQLAAYTANPHLLAENDTLNLNVELIKLNEWDKFGITAKDIKWKVSSDLKANGKCAFGDLEYRGRKFSIALDRYSLALLVFPTDSYINPDPVQTKKFLVELASANE